MIYSVDNDGLDNSCGDADHDYDDFDDHDEYNDAGSNDD